MEKSYTYPEPTSAGRKSSTHHMNQSIQTKSAVKKTGPELDATLAFGSVKQDDNPAVEAGPAFWSFDEI